MVINGQQQAQQDAYDEGVADGMRKIFDDMIHELEDLETYQVLEEDDIHQGFTAVDWEDIKGIIDNLKCERDSLD